MANILFPLFFISGAGGAIVADGLLRKSMYGIADFHLSGEGNIDYSNRYFIPASRIDESCPSINSSAETPIRILLAG